MLTEASPFLARQIQRTFPEDSNLLPRERGATTLPLCSLALRVFKMTISKVLSTLSTLLAVLVQGLGRNEEGYE